MTDLIHNHKISRRQLLGSGVALAGSPVLALAQQGGYPSKTIEWVVPYPPGGGTDVVARTLAEEMSRLLGQTIVINNRPGAATNIGADYVAHAKPDGYVLMSADTATLAANPHLYTKLNYSAEKDLAPVGLTVRFPLILVVNAQVPVHNLAEFRNWAKTQGSVNFASPGAGSPHHLAMELFRDRTGLAMTHIPYRGAAPAVQDVVGGQVPCMFVDTASGQGFINAGKLIPVGIASARRVKNFETIATLDEQGLKGFEAFAWQGLAVPTGTPAAVIEKLNTTLRQAMDTTAVKARLQALGLEASFSGPKQMADYVAAERSKWGEVIRKAGIRLD